MTDKKASLLEKVRGLLAKAANTPFAEEAAAFQAKADELMTKYAIEEWELAKKDGGTQKPISRNMDISWWYSMNTGVEDALWRLFQYCASHARCAVVWWRQQNRSLPVVGMENDLDYMDMLFTDLMLQLVNQLDPKADPNLSYFDNLRRMREAGNSWPDAARKMLAHPQFDPRPESSSFKVKQDQMTRDYRNECKKRGIEQNYNHFKTFGRNFADGFATRIGLRMAEMRKTTQEEGSGSSVALAIRDIRLVIRDAVSDMFGAPPRSRGSSAMDTRKVDLSAVGAGQAAGAKARIASNADQLGGRKAIER